MKAQEITLEELVSGNRQFRVPLYQRTYSWQEKQWAPLWTAIREQAEALSDGDGGPGHFLGSVVLAPGPTFPSGPTCWIVVDGQQRLTTLALALCALRDRIRGEDEKLAVHIHEDLLVNRWEDGDHGLKVLPTQADRAAFRACVNGTPEAGGAGAIGEAYRFFQRMLEEFDDPDDPADLRRVERAITRRMEIVWIAADRNDNVHRIFESLNNTGLKLTQADLIRNYLFMLLPERGERVYQTVWQPMQDDLGTDGLELLAWLDLVVRGQAKVRRDDVYREQQRRLRYLEALRDEDRVEAEVAEFARRSRLLGLLQHPDRESHPQVRRALRRLAAWDAVTTYPMAMVLLDRRDRQTATNDEIVEGLTCLESFLVRRMLCGTPTNNLNRILNSAPPELADGPLVEAVREYLSRERHYWADDTTLREAIRERNFYWSGRAQQRQFVLRRIEESFGHKEPIDWDRASLTIEHVLPQKLNAAWRRELEPRLTAGQNVREVHAALVHTLGNLTLTGYNSQLSNKPFADKRDMLRDSGLAMNHAIASHKVWGPNEITERADALADKAIELWPGPNERPAAPSTERPKWRTLRQVLAALPAGTWTTTGDLAEVVSSYQGVVTRQLKNHAFPNAWRVLQVDGTPGQGLRWPDGMDPDDHIGLLTAEGIRFADGVANEHQRMWAVELADLIGLNTAADAVDFPERDALLETAFWEVFAADDDQAIIEGLHLVIDSWKAAGGELRVSADEELIGYLYLKGETPIAPWAIYPESDFVEVKFVQLKSWSPFDDAAKRERFRSMCNAIPEVEIPAPKIDFLPWFSLQALTSQEGVQAACAALAWFAGECQPPRTP